MTMKKVLLFVLIVSIVTLAFSGAVFADDDNPLDWLDGKKADAAAAETKKSIDRLGINIFTIINGFGYIAGFILLIIHGIKHWFAGGDSTAKKELKDQGFNWLKGAIFVFGGSFIYTLIYTFVSKL